MSRRAVLFGRALLAIAAAPACSSSNSSPVSGSPDATALCPATPDLTVDRPCAPEGLRCAPDYPCGVTTATLSCTCTRGIFQCSDGMGNPISHGQVPACPLTSFEGGACPATERAAQLAPCSEPGLLCAYPSACPSAFDSCQCFAGRTATAQFGLRFECSPQTCSDRDAATPSDPQDSATVIDARNDSTRAGAAEAGAENGAGDATDAALALDTSSRSETGATDAQPVDATLFDAAGE